MQKLTLKQRKFCLAYVGEANGNGVEAARIAGYKGNDVTLAAVAYENLRKPQIVQHIAELRAEAEKQATGKILSATEVLVGLSAIAEGDIADVLGELAPGWLIKAKEKGLTRLIKTVNFDKDTGNLTKLELYSAKDARVDLGKYHKLFVDKFEIVTPEDLDAALAAELARVAGADQAAGAGETESPTVH